MADVADVELAVVELVRARLDVGFDIVEQHRHVDFPGREFHLPPVAKPVVDRCAAAGSLRGRGLEATPVLDNLVELLLPAGPVAGMLAKAPLPGLGGLGILPAVLMNLRQFHARLFRIRLAGISGDLLEDFQEVELVRQREPFDSRGEPGDRLVLPEGVQCVGAALLFFRVVDRHAAERDSKTGQGLDAELALQKLGEVIAHLVAAVGVHFDGLLQGPSPALAVAAGGVEGFRSLVVNRVPVGVDRGGGRSAAIAPALLVVGQSVQVGQRLQSPGFAEPAVVQQHLPEVEEELADRRALIVALGQRHSLNHQLQGADAVALG